MHHVRVTRKNRIDWQAKKRTPLEVAAMKNDAGRRLVVAVGASLASVEEVVDSGGGGGGGVMLASELRRRSWSITRRSVMTNWRLSTQSNTMGSMLKPINET